MIDAYLDPASGSAIVSAAVAGAAGVGVAARTMMTKMRMRRRSGSDEPESEGDRIGEAGAVVEAPNVDEPIDHSRQ